MPGTLFSAKPPVTTDVPFGGAVDDPYVGKTLAGADVGFPGGVVVGPFGAAVELVTAELGLAEVVGLVLVDD